MLPVIATVIDSSWIYETIAKVASAVALWASLRAERSQPTPDEALRDLTLRLRHPWKYRAQQVTRLFK